MWARLCRDCQHSKGQPLRRAKSRLDQRAAEIAEIKARGYIGDGLE
jgi:hypothetical protein